MKYSWLNNKYIDNVILNKKQLIVVNQLRTELSDFETTEYGYNKYRNFEGFWSTIYRQLQIGKNQYVFVVNLDQLINSLKPYYIGKTLLRRGVTYELVKLQRKTFKKVGLDQYGDFKNVMIHIVFNELDLWMRSQWMDSPVMDNYTHRVKNGIVDKSNARRHVRNSKCNLKEFYYYRYNNEFIVLGKSYSDIKRCLEAFKRWIGKRFGHQFDNMFDDIMVKNLKTSYVTILGYRLSLKQRSNKWVVKSQIDPILLKHYDKSMRQDLKRFLRGGSVKYYTCILDYNKKVVTLHSYFKYATNVSIDLSKLHYHHSELVRLKSKNTRKNVTKIGEITYKPWKYYEKSKALRFVISSGQPILPISYIAFKKPMFKENKRWSAV